jgi:hypothetical protein
MKYQIVAKNGNVIDIVEGVSAIKLADGFFYFYEQDRDAKLVVTSDVVKLIKKID